MDALVFDHVSFAFENGEGERSRDMLADASADAALRADFKAGSDAVLRDVEWRVARGGFGVLTGNTGSGKSTLLRLCVPALAPRGELCGRLEVNGAVGYVAQNPDAQLVCDTVRRELAFGLENAGMPPDAMRCRIAEVATFLGIDSWMSRRCAELSGGQKQMVALAVALACAPDVLLLDEPTSQLDPIAEQAFVDMLARVWRVAGTTIVVATHSPATFAHLRTTSYTLDCSKTGAIDGMCADESASMAFFANLQLKNTEVRDSGLQNNQKSANFAKNKLKNTEVREFENSISCLRRFEVTKSKKTPSRQLDASDSCNFAPDSHASGTQTAQAPAQIGLKHVYFAYDRAAAPVLEDCSIAFDAGGVHALVGGNGSGKSTALKLMAGALRPVHGRVISSVDEHRAYLPQNVESLFVCDSVLEELMEWSGGGAVFSKGRRGHRSAPGLVVSYGQTQAVEAARAFGLQEALERHPFDLSGGEQRLLAIAKLMLLRPRILLADEPTCGLDAPSCRAVAAVFKGMSDAGLSVIFATHDLDFAAKVADDVAMVFDGQIGCPESTADFFAGNLFYRPAVFPGAQKVQD
jgi:energy-coupling factor transport system ATP-binding protein